MGEWGSKGVGEWGSGGVGLAFSNIVSTGQQGDYFDLYCC